MRAGKLTVLLTATTLALALQSASVLASKPSPGQGRDKSEKVDARGGPPRHADNERRTGFSDSRAGRRDDDRRGDDRDGGWRDDPRYRDHRDRDDRHGDDDRRDRDRWDRDRWDDDDRYDHDRYRYTYDRHYYPRRGHVVHRLPPRYRVVHYHGAPYYYGDGHWYRPYGPSFMIVAPPIGLTLSFLPDLYTTMWFGGIPYYRAHDVYYRWHPQRRAYMVVTLPIG
jgi:hypothetical protein